MVLGAAMLGSVPSPAKSSDLPSLYQWQFREPVKTESVRDAQQLLSLFAAQDYVLPHPGKPAVVPRIYLSRLVEDFASVQPVRIRTGLFIRAVAPLVLRSNEKILKQRAELERIIGDRDEGRTLSAGRTHWLDALAELYAGDTTDLAALRNRVDIVPPSLAIAQAINESGWGTGSLAIKSNGLFGQHASSWLRSGTVRAASGNVSVAAFPTLLDGVSAYMTNLNRNRAYAAVRALRAERRRKGEAPDGHALAGGLTHYSGRGSAYVTELRRLISGHKLSIYDTARLAPDGGTVLLQADR